MPGKMSNSFYFLYHNVLFAIEIPLNLPIQIGKVPKCLTKMNIKIEDSSEKMFKLTTYTGSS